MSIYAGPGKVVMAANTNTIGGITAALAKCGLQVEGENGQIKLEMVEETSDISSAMFSKLGVQYVDQYVELDFTPLDNWGAISVLHPPWLGASVAGPVTGSGTTVTTATGVPQIGCRPHGAVNVATNVWTPDGRLYPIVRTAVMGHPSLHLGIGKPLFGGVKILGIGDTVTPVAPGTPGYLMGSISESAGADPENTSTMSMTDFTRCSWTGAWGSVTGFTAVQAEQEWTIECEAKYSKLKLQGRTVAMQLNSVAYMAKCRPYGPTHTQILAQVAAHVPGMRFASGVSPSVKNDLVLTADIGGKTITLKNAELKGGGFEFGGTGLTTGEIGFVCSMSFTAGAPTALIVFSA